MKRYFVAVMVMALALALAACGGKEEPAPAPEPQAAAVEAAAPVEESAGDAAAGKDLFVSTCSACHGPEGKGVTGLGKDMTHSEFIAEKTDAELLAFIETGRAPDDPLNTTGVLMPPKGGNPALTDEQLMDIIAYIRSIHE